MERRCHFFRSPAAFIGVTWTGVAVNAYNSASQVGDEHRPGLHTDAGGSNP